MAESGGSGVHGGGSVERNSDKSINVHTMSDMSIPLGQHAMALQQFIANHPIKDKLIN
jgi:hypothetical protein